MKVEVIKPEDVGYTDAPIKVTTCGNVIETMSMSKVNRKGSAIINLGDYKYVLPGEIDNVTGEITGEIKEFNRTDNRSENLNGLAKSMKAVRDLINCNVVDPSCVRWVTLTYAENMTDTKRLYTDTDKFIKRLKYYHNKNGLEDFEYIHIVEPQGRGAWHIHGLWIYKNKAPYLPNNDIADLWQHGFVTVKKLDEVDNVGAYITAYLCDVPVEEYEGTAQPKQIKTVEVENEDGKKVKKKYVKGGRLHLYPSKMNFYRTSRGVKRPTVEWMKREQAKEKVKAGTLTYSKAIRLSDGDEFTSEILYEYYNTVGKYFQEKKQKS